MNEVLRVGELTRLKVVLSIQNAVEESDREDRETGR